MPVWTFYLAAYLVVAAAVFFIERARGPGVDTFGDLVMGLGWPVMLVLGIIGLIGEARFRYDGPIPIIELQRDPFGHGSFAFGLLGLPGIIVRGPSGRAPAINEVAETCLELHEVGHWHHWGLWALAWGLVDVAAVPDNPGLNYVMLWWVLYGYQTLLLGVPPFRRWTEGLLDHQQMRCKEELRG